jgi:hypothetical protein
MEAVTPRHLEDEVWPQKVVASVKHTDVALAAADVDELSR